MTVRRYNYSNCETKDKKANCKMTKIISGVILKLVVILKLAYLEKVTWN